MSFNIMFFLPSILGLLVYYVLTKEEKYFDLGLIYLVNVLFTNLGNVCVLFLGDKVYYSLITRLEGDFRFAFKYMLLGVVFSFIIGIICSIIKKYCSVSVEVKNGKKK